MRGTAVDPGRRAGRARERARRARGGHAGRRFSELRLLLLTGGLVAGLVAGGTPEAMAQEGEGPEYDVQLPEGAGTYPTGSLLIRDLDAIWTATGEVIEGGSILIRDGVIEEVGTEVSLPEGGGDVEVVDGTGLTAIPGLVDEHSHTGMTGGGNEGTEAVVPEVKVLDALDPGSFGIYRALSGGVTTARIMHGSSNPIGGQSAVIKMRWGMEAARDLLVPGAPRFVKFALGENVTRKNRRRPDRPTRFPASRPGVEAILEEAFTAARAYRDAWARYDEDPASFDEPPRRDLRLEALVDIMEGRIRVHAHSYRADEILMLLRLAERYGFRIDVLTHVMEGFKVAAEMAEHGAAGSTFSDWWQYKLEAYDAIPHNAALMHEAGVLTAINSDIPWLQSFMIHEIPKPVKYGGVSKEEALRMLTLNPARMMHIDDRVGSLEAGKEGDVVLLSADPFDAYARVEKTVVDGIVYYDLSDEEETRDEPFIAQPDFEPGAPVADRARAVPRRGSSAGGGSGDGGEAGGSGAQRPEREPLQGDDFALVGGTVHPVASGAIENGVVVVRAGLITAVGPRSRIEVPDDVEVVDVSGRHVYPGMIDPLTYLGLFEFGQSGNATDVNDTGDYNPHLRAISSVDMHGAAIPVARANGITAALTAQQTGVVQGTAGFIQLRGDTWERAAVEAEAALVVDLPAPSEAPEDAEEPSLEDDEALAGLVELFLRAREYEAEPTVRRDPTAAFWPNQWGGDRVPLEAMVPVMRGERPVLFRAATEWQIRTLFRFLDEFPELDAALVEGDEAWKVADELARRELPVIITSAYSPTSSRDESITAAYRNAAHLERAGVTVAFGTDDSPDVRNLPYHAAHSVAFGLSRLAAVRAVTLAPAEILGVDAVTGSLEAGKRADLIVTDGDPLQYLTRVERMFIEGVEVDPRENKHDRLFGQFRGRR